MPCILCIAVFAMLAGAITTSVLDSISDRLSDLAAGPVQRTADTGSVARFDFEVPAHAAGSGGVAARVPVAVTVHKQHKRVRIQVLTHAVSRDAAEAIEDRIAEALELQIISRQDAHTEEHRVPTGTTRVAETHVGRVEPDAALG